jgi:hypothetical protein
MKTNIVITLALLLAAVGVQAQHSNLGIKGGLNAYTVAGDNSGGRDYKFGFHIGLLTHFHMGDQFALQPELTYSTQGTLLNSGNSDELNLNYLNIPVLFQYMFDNGFRLQAGPQLGILTSAESKIGNTTTDVKDNFNGTDIGLTIGMSYVKPSTGFGYDFRYNHGLTNINDSNATNSYNRGWQLGLFYLFEHN